MATTGIDPELQDIFGLPQDIQDEEDMTAWLFSIKNDKPVLELRGSKSPPLSDAGSQDLGKSERLPVQDESVHVSTDADNPEDSCLCETLLQESRDINFGEENSFQFLQSFDILILVVLNDLQKKSQDFALTWSLSPELQFLKANTVLCILNVHDENWKRDFSALTSLDSKIYRS